MGERCRRVSLLLLLGCIFGSAGCIFLGFERDQWIVESFELADNSSTTILDGAIRVEVDSVGTFGNAEVLVEEVARGTVLDSALVGSGGSLEFAHGGANYELRVDDVDPAVLDGGGIVSFTLLSDRL